MARRKRCGVWATVLAAVLVMFAGLGSPTAHAAGTGSVSGIVRDSAGNPLPGICVIVDGGPGV